MAKNYRKSDVAKAVAKSKGLVSAVAGMLKCDWHTANKYIIKFGLLEDLQNQTEIMLDFAESKLFKCIGEQDPAMIKFYLESKGKSRGYGKETRMDVVSTNLNATIKLTEKQKHEAIERVKKGLAELEDYE